MRNKSINASRLTETRFLNPYESYLHRAWCRMTGQTTSGFDFQPNTAPASGVNPTHSPETRVGHE